MTIDYDYPNRVTSMLKELKWQPLAECGRDQRLCLLYKIVNDLVAIPADQRIIYNHQTQENQGAIQTSSHVQKRTGILSKILSKQYLARILQEINITKFRLTFIPRTTYSWSHIAQILSFHKCPYRYRKAGRYRTTRCPRRIM
jgi:hypothetical protein